MLKEFGVPEEVTMSIIISCGLISFRFSKFTELSHITAADVNSLMFARGTRFSQMEAQEVYKEECRRVFELQHR